MVLKSPAITVRPVSEGDRQRLANLIHFEPLVHRHLDWRPPLEWIGAVPYWVAEQRHELAAALACPPDPPWIAWIRLFAVSGSLPASRAWQALWPEARAQLLAETQATVAAAIPLQRWFRSLLERDDFTFTHSVLVLAWSDGDLPPSRDTHSARIRAMQPEDLQPVLEVDQLAFGQVWQNSLDGLELAYRQSAVATVAESEGRLVGYQISTATSLGGHLARLAVLPEMQGRGIGYELLAHLLSEFKRRGAHSVTVNTQHDNHVSLALYQKAGFRPNGEEYPVYQHTLKRDSQ
jgi:ribosomal protein S18 acetylase RimI-like enzyme